MGGRLSTAEGGVRERERIAALLSIERSFWERRMDLIAGVDEVGRGPLAGPVVAAAVVFPPDIYIEGIDDSKKLSSSKRELLFLEIYRRATAVGLGIVHNTEIDRINILRATHQAMRKALGRLPLRPHHVLIDGAALPEEVLPMTALVDGDRRCFSIAAASIFAKVVRDRLMTAYDRVFPLYGFAQHKGYGTRQHIEAIRCYGLCPIHRRSFRVKELLGGV